MEFQSVQISNRWNVEGILVLVGDQIIPKRDLLKVWLVSNCHHCPYDA
jgi:hypothetical protein